MKTIERTVNDEVASRVTSKLIRRSQWFQVTPLPDGMYEIAVKIENAVFLDQMIADATPRKELRCPKCGNTDPEEFKYQESTLVEWDVRRLIGDELAIEDEYETLESCGPGIVVCQRRLNNGRCLHEFHWAGTAETEINLIPT